jgi:hypothetical protein
MAIVWDPYRSRVSDGRVETTQGGYIPLVDNAISGRFGLSRRSMDAKHEFDERDMPSVAECKNDWIDRIFEEFMLMERFFHIPFYD